MARIPLEDSYVDILGKAQRGLNLSDDDLARRAGVSLEELLSLKAGHLSVAVLRRVARHLRLGPNALEAIATRSWYPAQPNFPNGFAIFNTAMGDMTVNSYIVWDARTKRAAIFDTGAVCDQMLDTVNAEGLTVDYIFLTHTHDDHIADLSKLIAGTRAPVWSHENEPVAHEGAKTFRENAHFHVGSFSVKTLLTSGHSPGLTTFYITGLSWPLAIVGDSIFAGSMGGSATHYEEQWRNNREKLFSLPRDTVIAPGHGPLSTLAQEKQHNPFFAK